MIENMFRVTCFMYIDCSFLHKTLNPAQPIVSPLVSFPSLAIAIAGFKRINIFD